MAPYIVKSWRSFLNNASCTHGEAARKNYKATAMSWTRLSPGTSHQLRMAGRFSALNTPVLIPIALHLKPWGRDGAGKWVTASHKHCPQPLDKFFVFGQQDFPLS